MPPTTDEIVCPRHPAHGLATKRLLPPEERENLTKAVGDVFEIRCRICGRYEYEVPRYSDVRKL
jgi:hypothetical protein